MRREKAGFVAGCLAVLLIALAAPGWPQVHGGAAHMRAPAGRMSSWANRRVGTPLNPNFGPLHGVPGLGFDFAHLVATRGGLQSRNEERDEHRVRFLTPILFGNFPFYYPFDETTEYEPQTQPTVVVVQQPPQTVVVQPSTSPAEAVPSTPPPRPDPPTELEPLSLVRRDGKVLLSVGFTISGDRLTYVTPEGIRRSLPIADLDKDSTRQMNDASGTMLVLPN